MEISKMWYLPVILFFTLYSCNSGTKQNDPKTVYYAVNKRDTATLVIKLSNKEFYGQLEINYRGAYKDSGSVTGIIKGDTLKGTYRFHHYGIETQRSIPIALLKKDNKLYMGVGAMEIYMNMAYFKKSIPINYQNPSFIFEKQ
jgi:hypothetical protein